MSRANERIEVAETTRKKALMRPWLQDFSAPWIKRDYGVNFVTYGPKQVRAQIEATYDAGYEEWILWSASNNYTREALLPEGVTDSTGYFSFDPRAPYIIKARYRGYMRGALGFLTKSMPIKLLKIQEKINLLIREDFLHGFLIFQTKSGNGITMGFTCTTYFFLLFPGKYILWSKTVRCTI